MADALSSVFPEEKCKVVCDDARCVGVSVRHERCVEQSGHDGAKDKSRSLRYANVEIPEFMKIGVVIRQAEEGPIRTHLIMNSHNLTTFPK